MGIHGRQRNGPRGAVPFQPRLVRGKLKERLRSCSHSSPAAAAAKTGRMSLSKPLQRTVGSWTFVVRLQCSGRFPQLDCEYAQFVLWAKPRDLMS